MPRFHPSISGFQFVALAETENYFHISTHVKHTTLWLYYKKKDIYICTHKLFNFFFSLSNLKYIIKNKNRHWFIVIVAQTIKNIYY